MKDRGVDEDGNNIHNLNLGDGLPTRKVGGFKIAGIYGGTHKAKLDGVLVEVYWI